MNYKAITCCALLITSLTLTACSIGLSPSAINPKKILAVNTEQTLPAFTQLVVSGPLHVVLTQQGQPKIQVKGSTNAVAQLVAEIQDQTLYLRSLQNTSVKDYPMATAYINVGLLNALSLSGAGTITATELNTPALTITVNNGQSLNLAGRSIGLQRLNVIGQTPITIRGIKTNTLNVQAQQAGNITLEGIAGLSNLNYHGLGKFKMAWVKGGFVKVQSQQGQLFLAGIANSLDAVLSREAQLNARYLRTQNASINTADNARVDVWASNKLNALATGASNIYYYRTPQLLTKYMRQQGSVLFIHANAQPIN